MAEESTGHKRLGDTHGKAQAGREAAKEKTFKESFILYIFSSSTASHLVFKNRRACNRLPLASMGINK